ncbi:MAG TPA: ribosome maturation factor RimM [Acidobacteriaceae bacterium]|nr:ribosome maturation factor RimM [Acidobacteriaceae bacterium]
MSADEPWVILARLVRPQGRVGEVLANILTDFPDRFAERKRLFLVSSETSREPVREVMLERHWLHKGRVVLKFAGVDSISDAEALRGLLVAIPASERAELTDGSVYIGDLMGCEVIDLNAAKSVGVVADVDHEAGLLEVKTPGGEEALVPFAKAYLVRMDVAGKRIEMRLPEGLLDINAPVTDEERSEIEHRG